MIISSSYLTPKSPTSPRIFKVPIGNKMVTEPLEIIAIGYVGHDDI
jgi:hypothetical protein